jgi:DNA-binding NarL/FixJ family response regulator
MARSDSISEQKQDATLPVRTGLLRIWLVDDQDGFRQPLAKLLNLEPGVECARHFSSAAAVLLALQEQSPDAILLDVEMPKMSGVEAVQPIKQLAPATAVLMLTTFSNDEARELALAGGAADFLLKHYSPGEIVAAIRAAQQPRGAESGFPPT